MLQQIDPRLGEGHLSTIGDSLLFKDNSSCRRIVNDSVVYEESGLERMFGRGVVKICLLIDSTC